jgi:hypothetical protein
MKNSFGNYVVQKALKLATGFMKVKLTNNIKKNMEKLTDKKLVNKWKSILLNCSNPNLTLLSRNNFNDSFGSNNLNSSYGSTGSNNSFHSTGQTVTMNMSNQMVFIQPGFNKIYPRSGGNSPSNITYRFPSPNLNFPNPNVNFYK